MKAILRQHKFLSGTYIFCPKPGSKNYPQKIGSKIISFEAIFTKFSVWASWEKSVWKLYWGSSKFFHVRTIFDRDRAKKTSLTKLVLKNSVLKQSLPNSQFKLLGRSQYESYLDAAQNFFMYVQFLIGIGHKKLPSLNWF